MSVPPREVEVGRDHRDVIGDVVIDIDARQVLGNGLLGAIGAKARLNNDGQVIASPAVVRIEEKQPLLKPIPECSWKCARVRAQKQFIGPSICMQQAETLVKPGDVVDPRYVYGTLPIKTEKEELPPTEEYVVLGIFGSDGSLLEEVIVYIGGSTKSYHLYHGQRHLFRLPFLRDITSFGLYKCDQEGRSHVRVDLSAEDKDRINSLFVTIRTWSTYHDVRDTLEELWPRFAYSLSPIVILLWIFIRHEDILRTLYMEAVLAYYRRLGLLKRPKVQDEDALCNWLHENLNGGNKDPSAGQYSLEVVVGWSRQRIVTFVVVPVLLFLVGVTSVAIVLSIVKGNIGWFGVASYCSGLAAAYVAMVGFLGGNVAYK